MEKYIKLLENINYIDSIDELKSCNNTKSKRINERINELEIKNKINEVKTSSFGYVKDIFENISPILFITPKGRECLKNYLSTIKENKTLSDLYILHENICNSNIEKNEDVYLTESLNLVGVINKKDYTNGIESLVNILSEAIKYVDNIEIHRHNIFVEKNSTINESLSYLTTNKKSLKNIDKFTENFKNITEHISKKKENISNVNFDKLSESIANNTEIINNFITNNVNEETYNSYKNECIAMLESTIISSDNNMADRLKEIKNKISEKEYNISTVSEDISFFNNLKNMLNN